MMNPKHSNLGKTLTAAAFILMSAGAIPSAQAQNADVILSNANILTVDKDFSIAQSLAIRGSRVLAVGTDQAVGQHKGPATRVIDLQGKTVIPGLIDNHFHFIRSVWNYQHEVRLDGVKSRKTALAMISKKARSTPPGDWITVIGGWTSAQFLDQPGGFSLAELDGAAPKNPLYLLRNYSTHYANSRALKLAGLDPADGARLRGRRSARPFNRFIGWRNKSASPQTIRSYMAALNALGLTTVYDVGRPSEGKLEPLATLAATGPMPLRVFHTLRYRATDKQSTIDALQLITKGRSRPLSMDAQFGIVGLGEHLYGPMHDRANRRDSWPEDIWGPVRSLATAAAKHGWPIHEHTASRVTVTQFLDLVEEIAVHTPKVKTLRWTLAHALGITEADAKRAARLGVAYGIHSSAIMNTRSQNRPLLGSIERSGVLWGLGSDGAIVAPINPFLTLGWVVTGRNIAGKEAWTMDQRVSRKAALIAHTLSNARLLFKEHEIGSLEKGKMADLVVLDQDFMTVPENEIAAIRPVLTMTGGRIVYERK